MSIQINLIAIRIEQLKWRVFQYILEFDGSGSERLIEIAFFDIHVMSRFYRIRLDSFRTLRLTLNKLRSNIRLFNLNISSFHMILGNISPKRHDVAEPTWINLIRDPITWYESSFYFKRLGWSQKPGARRRNDTEVGFQTNHFAKLLQCYSDLMSLLSKQHHFENP